MQSLYQNVKPIIGITNTLVFGLFLILSIFLTLTAFPWLPFYSGDGLTSLLLVFSTPVLFFCSVINCFVFKTVFKKLIIFSPFLLSFFSLVMLIFITMNIGSSQSSFVKIAYLVIVFSFMIFGAYTLFLLTEQSILLFKQDRK